MDNCIYYASILCDTKYKIHYYRWCSDLSTKLTKKVILKMANLKKLTCQEKMALYTQPENVDVL